MSTNTQPLARRRHALADERPALWSVPPAEAAHSWHVHVGTRLSAQELDEFRSRMGAAAVEALAAILAAREGRP